MADHDQVVELRALADDRFVDHGPVDGRAGADFDVVFDADRTVVGNSFVAAIDQAVTKAVGSDHGSAVDGHAIADDDVFIKNDVRMQHDFVAQLATAADDHSRMNVAVVADDHARRHMGTGMDIRVSPIWAVALT